MSLSWFLIVVVLCGAFMHACWNAVIKSGRDSMLDTALVMFASSLLAGPVLLWVGLPDPQSWRWIGTALAIHLVLYFALSRTYRQIDLGLAYPMMRGMSPMLVALMSAATVGEVPSATLWSGVLLISTGVLVLGAPQFVQLARRMAGQEHDATLAPAGLAWAALCACCIAATSIVGALGVRVSGNVPAYLFTMVCLDGLPFACIVLWLRRGEVSAYARQRWPLSALGGACAIGAYASVLWAVTQAPVAAIAALRETSVIFAALLGYFVLKESFGWNKLAGTVVVLAGVFVLRS